MNRIAKVSAGLMISGAGIVFFIGLTSIAAAALDTAPATPQESLARLKAQGVFDAPTWDAYFESDRNAEDERRSLDQGGDNFGNATPILNLPYNDFGQTTGFQNNYYDVCQPPPGPDQAPDVVYVYHTVQPQVVDISLCGSTNFDTQLYVYQNAYTPGNPYACDDDFCPPFQSRVSGLALNPGMFYFIVVDGWGGSMGFYTITMTSHTLQPCPCANPEQEPNDGFPVQQTISMGMDFCGVISHPQDFDFVRLDQNVATAVRVTLLGNAGPGPCPGGQGLHPSACILAEDASEVDENLIAYAGDTTNQSTYFESTFELGPYAHILEISGANGTTGPYILRVDPIDLPTVAPPTPQLTIQTSGGQTRLHWNASYLPGEVIEISDAATPDGPWFSYALIFGGPPNITVPTTTGVHFFRARASGERPRSPFVGAVVPLSEPGGNEFEDVEVAQFQINEVEWGRDGQGNVGMTRWLAHGVGPSTGELIDQDNRNLYQNGMTPITDFAGTKLNIFGREVMVEHCAFVRDELTGTIGIADGRGRNPAGDSLMYFSDSPQYLTPEFGVTGNWVGWFWFDPCPSFCCRLKVVAFCRSTLLAWAPVCVSPGVCPGNPTCYLGCPCPPVGFLCTFPPPGCSPCALVPDPNFALRRWCTCQATVPPGPSAFCFFQIWVKCKFYDCPDGFVNCFCPGAPPCPTFPVWTLVPFVNSAMRAACKVDCTF